jgi:hypothetical protein
MVIAQFRTALESSQILIVTRAASYFNDQMRGYADHTFPGQPVLAMPFMRIAID